MAELQHHLQMKPGDVGRYVLLPGDPARARLIAGYFDQAEVAAQNREYLTYTGTVDGIRLSVTSTGIGGPSTAIAVEELIRIGADTFIRVGTAGGVHPSVKLDDLVIATGAVRDEGTSKQYVPLAYPAVAHPAVVSALIAGCQDLGEPFRVGLLHSKDSFYGEVEPDTVPLADKLHQQWKAWVAGNVLASEMEASTLFVVSAVRGTRAGAIVKVFGTAEGSSKTRDVDNLIRAAIAGVKRLAQFDKEADQT